MIRTSQRALLLVLTGALAGCGGGSSSPPPNCTPPPGTQTVLVYPAPNATGIPDNVGLVVLASTATLPSTFDTWVVDNTTGNGVFFNAVTTSPPSPLPTPNATPTFADPVYQPSGNPGVTFVAGSTITVYLNQNANCTPISLGSFSVQ